MRKSLFLSFVVTLLLILGANPAAGQDRYYCWGCTSIGGGSLCENADGDTGRKDWCDQYYDPVVCNFSMDDCITFIYDEFPADLSTSVAGTYLGNHARPTPNDTLTRDRCTGLVIQTPPAKEDAPEVIKL